MRKDREINLAAKAAILFLAIIITIILAVCVTFGYIVYIFGSYFGLAKEIREFKVK